MLVRQVVLAAALLRMDFLLGLALQGKVLPVVLVVKALMMQVVVAVALVLLAAMGVRAAALQQAALAVQECLIL
jgi:hypothetical protein